MFKYWISKVLNVLGKLFFSNPKHIYNNLEEVYKYSSDFYDKSDLVYFENLNIYGAFKYNVVKDILENPNGITVSDVHLKLNNVYFSLDENIHKKNKSIAVNNLDFLSKKLQNAENEYTYKVFNLLMSHFPKDKSFDLVDYLIAPTVFINILKEYGFLQYMEEFNPESNAFEIQNVIEKITSFSIETDKLYDLISNYFSKGGLIPDSMLNMVNDIKRNTKVHDKDLPLFFTSMIFAGVESTVSFITSYLYVLFKNYPALLNNEKNQKELYNIANEVLRIYTPVPYIYRTVRKDTNYGKVRLKKGDTIALFLSSANMDKNFFEEPDKVKFNRGHKHLSFGKGEYACIGRFASFRLALNLVNYLSSFSDSIRLVEKKPKFKILNGMLKTNLLISIKRGNRTNEE